ADQLAPWQGYDHALRLCFRQNVAVGAPDDLCRARQRLQSRPQGRPRGCAAFYALLDIGRVHLPGPAAVRALAQDAALCFLVVLERARRGDRRYLAPVLHRLVEAREIRRPAAHEPGDAAAAGLDIGADIVEHQTAQPVGILRGVDHRDDAAHRGADQYKAADAELIDERRQIAGLIGVLVGVVLRPGALAVAAHIHRNNVRAILDPPRQRVERLGARCVTVHADDR